MFLSYDRIIRYIYWLLAIFYMLSISYYYNDDRFYIIINLLICYILLVYYELISPFFHYYSLYNKFLYSDDIDKEISLLYDNKICEYTLVISYSLILYISKPISDSLRSVYTSDKVLLKTSEIDRYISCDIGVSLLYSGYFRRIVMNILLYSILYIIMNLLILTL